MGELSNICNNDFCSSYRLLLAILFLLAIKFVFLLPSTIDLKTLGMKDLISTRIAISKITQQASKNLRLYLSVQVGLVLSEKLLRTSLPSFYDTLGTGDITQSITDPESQSAWEQENY